MYRISPAAGIRHSGFAPHNGLSPQRGDAFFLTVGRRRRIPEVLKVDAALEKILVGALSNHDAAGAQNQNLIGAMEELSLMGHQHAGFVG